MKRRYLLLPLLALLAVVACGGGGPAAPILACQAPAVSSEPDAAAFPAEVSGSNGTSAQLDAPPRRVASLSAGHTEIIYAIGAGAQVAAVDKTSDCPQAAADLPQVDAFTPSTEAIAALDPDLVVLFYDPGDLQPSLEAIGIPVLFLDSPSSVEGVFEQVRLLGQATGHSDEAEQLVADMEERIEAITDRLADIDQGPSVFHEIDTNYFSAGTGSFVGDLYDILKARNIAAATGESFPQLSAEAIIDAGPEVIVLADEDAGESPATVKARPGWSAVSAVQNDRIYAIDPDIVSRPGPRLVDALEALAAVLYPELFP